eukprot:s4552_g8.t1
MRDSTEEYREEYLEFREKCGIADLNNEMLAENIKILQNEVSTRNQVIRDIETKFTEYLQGYYQNVNSEFQTLNDRLTGSTTEVREYQAELMVAAQDDEGSTMRIQDLERKKNLAEDVAKRIHEKGMIMREEYQDQVIYLQGMLGHTEERIHQMEANSEHVQSVANHLHCEGLEMQNQLEYSIVQFRERSEMASIADRISDFEIQKSQNEIAALRESLELAQRGNYFNEESMKKIVRECRIKVSEANQQKLEGDHQLRVLRSEIELRRRQDQDQNSQAIADLRVRSQEVEDLRTQNGRLQAMLKAENETSQDYYWERLQVYVQADQERRDGLPAFGGVDRSPRVETLESEVKIQQLKINDMVDEASEYVKENLRLKDQVYDLTMNAPPAQSDKGIDKVRSELLTERKSNLVKLSEKDQVIWRLNNDQEDKRISSDVDEEDGGPRLSKRGTLKSEARSKSHLLTHRYKNPYCESCVRAKMKHRKTFRGAFQRKLTKFGDLVTFDFVDDRQVLAQDYGVEKNVFVIRDRYTGMIQAYPSARKNNEAVISAVKMFMGRRKIREAYSDMAPQFKEAMKVLRIPIDYSLAGKTKHNSLTERNNQFLLVATTTCMLEAGIPPCFWKYAIRCVSHLLNIEPNDEEVSAWCKLHGEEFKGKMIPFGALVFFKPSGARAVEQKHKFDPKGIPGVFAGYELAPGLHWSRKYRVWALTDWSKQSLAYNAGKPIPKLKTPHYTERVELREPLEFPCKMNYEKINVTIEGLKEKDRLEGSPDCLPLPPPEAGDDQDDDQDDGDAGDDDKGGGGGDGPDGGRKSGVDPSIMAEVEELEFMGAEDAARRADLAPPPGLEEPAPSSSSKPDRVIVPDSMIEHYLEGKKGDNIVYLNNDGEKVKIDKMGRLYRVDEKGYKIVRDSPRPAKYSPTEWQKVPREMRKETIRVQEMEADAARERSKVDRKIKDAEKTSKSKEEKKKEKEEKKKSSSSKSKGKKKDKGPDHDVGVSVEHEYSRPGKIFGIGRRSTSDECDGKHKMSSTITPSGCRSHALVSNNDMSDTDVPDDDDFLMEWDEWSEVEKGFGPKARWSNEKSYDFTNGKVVASAPKSFAPGDTINDPDKQNVFHPFPCMPCVHQCDRPHREKLGENYNGIDINKIFNTAVSRPVGRKEMMEDEDARKSMRKEWLGQHAAGVYDCSMVREYDDVVAEAKRTGKEVHMAHVHGICVEKNFQLPKGHPTRKFKGRGDLLGNKVKNQFWEAAFFQDLGNSPATFEASRWADFYWCLPGNDVKLADAIQAYIQAKLTGPPCWVELPEDAWPDDIDIRKFRRPVVLLVKALYGHPDSGTMWEQHCDRKVKELDFIPVGEEWPSMYFHKGLKLLLVIYVDDLKLSGPKENLAKGWEMLRTKLNIEPETDLGLYL